MSLNLKSLLVLYCLIIFTTVINQTSSQTKESSKLSETENYVKQYFNKISSKLLQYCQAISYSTWDLHLKPEDKEIQDKNLASHSTYDEFLQQIKTELSKYSWKNFKDDNLKRHIERIMYDSVPLPPDQAKLLNNLITNIELKKSQKLKLLDDPENVIDEGLSPKAYYNRLFQKNKHDWKVYQNSLGKQFKPLFPEFLQLSKEFLKNYYVTLDNHENNNYHNDSSNTKLLYNEIQAELKTAEALWNEDLAPFYTQLHSYIRGSLRLLYGRFIPKSDQLIPISVIGKLESWLDSYSDSIPFENSPSRDDITDALQIKLNVSTVDIFREVEEYFISINLPPMQPKFWSESIFDKPDTSDFLCDNTVHTFCYQNESRIIECDGVNFYTLNKAYPSLGNAKLYMMIKNMDYFPIPELDEVVIEALNTVWFLYGSSPERFRRMYLLEPSYHPQHGHHGPISSNSNNPPPTFESEAKRKKRNSEISINFQHFQALYILPELANLVASQKWFWSVFNGNVTDESLYNCEYWKLRAGIEGITPPIRRNKNHFDPFNLMNTYTYKAIQKFIGHIAAFQIHKALCITAGEYIDDAPKSNSNSNNSSSTATTTSSPKYVKYPNKIYEKRSGVLHGHNKNSGPKKPLRACDITDSKAVGNKLLALAASGSLSNWKKTLLFLTGSEELNTGPMLEYFKPYMTWLTDYNKKSRFSIGWKVPKGKTAPVC